LGGDVIKAGGENIPFAGGVELAGGFFEPVNGGRGEEHFALVVEQPAKVEVGVCLENTDYHLQAGICPVV